MQTSSRPSQTKRHKLLANDRQGRTPRGQPAPLRPAAHNRRARSACGARRVKALKFDEFPAESALGQVSLAACCSQRRRGPNSHARIAATSGECGLTAARTSSPPEDEPLQSSIADRLIVDLAVGVVVERRRARRALPDTNPRQLSAIREQSGLFDPHRVIVAVGWDSWATFRRERGDR